MTTAPQRLTRRASRSSETIWSRDYTVRGIPAGPVDDSRSQRISIHLHVNQSRWSTVPPRIAPRIARSSALAPIRPG